MFIYAELREVSDVFLSLVDHISLWFVNKVYLIVAITSCHGLVAVLLTCRIAWLPFSNSFCEIPKMHRNYHTVGFFLETEMFHFLKKMFSFLSSFLHFQVMRKCPILTTLSMTIGGGGGVILIYFS